MTEDPTPEWCPNCDGRECMACVFREVHDACEKSCPMCCAEPPEGTTEPLTTAADLLPSVKPSVEAVNFTEVANLAQEMLGKGVTAVPWGDPPDNWCLRHEQPRWVCRSSRVQGACEAGLWPTLYRAVVRSGEQGGE